MTELTVPPPLRVLIVTRNLPPLRGGMERLNLHMAYEIAQEHEIAVIGPRGCAALLPANAVVREVTSGALLWFFLGMALQSFLLSRRFRPNVVLAGSGLAAPFAWFAARLVSARLAIYVHGLDLIVDNRVYRSLWLPFIRRADLCIANSRNTAQLALTAGVAKDNIEILHPGVELPRNSPGNDKDFRREFAMGARPILLSVGRLIARKGLLEFVDSVLPSIVREFPDVCLVVLGDESPNMLSGYNADLATQIRARVAALKLDANVHFIGPQDDPTLASAYRAANVHVFPVREVRGDVEGFGMVAIEAASWGLRTVAFDVGGVPDAIADGVSGSVIARGDYPAFAEAVMTCLRDHDHFDRACCKAFAMQFAWPRFGHRLKQLLAKLVHGVDVSANPSVHGL